MRRRRLSVIADVHAVIEKQAGVGNVWSLETLRRWLSEKMGRSDVATLKQYVDILPPHLVRRFIAAEQDAVIVTGRIPDIDASKLLPVVDALNTTLNDVRAKYPGYTISVTGLAAIAARNSANMIHKLNLGLTLEFLLVAMFIGLVFRSVVVMFSIDPAGDFSGGAVGHAAVADGTGPAIRQRRGADRVVRTGAERDDPFPQSHAA